MAFSAAAILCVRFADFQVNFRRPGRRREGAEKASVKQKAAIIPGIFGLEMSKYLYDEDHLKVYDPRGVHRQHHSEVLRVPWVENVSKLKCTSEGDFLRILVDFRGHLGTQDGAKIEEKRHQKQERF